MSKNCHKPRTSNDFNMKLGSESKLDIRNMATSKKLTMTLCHQIMASSSMFEFMVDL